MLKREEIEALAEVVGEKWVCADPCMMDTYAFYMNPEVLNKEGGRWLPRPAAVVMPGNTEEVSGVVKVLNRFKLMGKPISTGWGAWAAVSRDRVVVLDLKRMDRIIDIDVKNRIAVVEPYVKAIILQTILWKHGLNLHVISCGGNHSVLASATSAWGTGLDGPSLSYSGRNLLGVEWVLPTGEVVQLGSAGAGCGWFSADGPGPSLRGIVRGYMGAFGGHGVFTKCAVKLYPWNGPKELEVSGASPHYFVENIPENMGLFMLSFPSARHMADAGYKLGEAEINYADFRLPPFYMAVGMTENNLELKKVWESGVFQRTGKFVMLSAVIGASRREFKWKMKALRQILKETRGVNLPLNLEATPESLPRMAKLMEFVDDPLALFRGFPALQELVRKLPVGKKNLKKAQSEIFWVALRHANNTQGNFRPSQAIFTTLGAFDTWDLGMKENEWIAEKKREYIEKGLILDDGGDLGCGGTFEHAHMGYIEGIGLYTRENPESVKAAGRIIEEALNACITEAFGIPIAGYGEDMNNRLGPHCWNYQLWLKKIKKALDPNTAFDPFFYVEPEDEEKQESGEKR